MSKSVFSSSWYRVGSLKPSLRRQAHLVRHSYRGETWHVLQDQAAGRFLRLDTTAYRIVSLMDGLRSVDEIWRHLCGELGDDAPTQSDVLGLLTQLHQANVLITERRPDLQEMTMRRQRSRQLKLKQYLGNPLSLRLPLFNPDPLLTRLVGLIPRGLWPVTLMAWSVLLAAGVTGVALHWDALTSDIAARVFTSRNMLLMALAFPLLKAIHELGHGIAIKALGGTCREVGLMFLIMMPVPYVDASSVSGFPDRRHRMLAGAAGMMIELAVASVAVWLWAWASPGVTQAFLHQVVILASITTILFNINPLLRFDGYYILSDWLEIPNLGQKANRYVGYLIQRRLFGAEGATAPRLTPRERPWLVAYAVGAFVYRMVVAVTIILTVASFFFTIGVLLAAWATYTMLLLPGWRMLSFLASAPVLRGRRIRAIAISVGGAVSLAAFVGLVPAPSGTVVQGIIWMPERARVRAPHDCFGAAVLAVPSQRVTAGTPLVTCEDPDLKAQLVQSRAEVQEMEARLSQANSLDRTKAQIIRAEMAFSADMAADIQGRMQAMTVRSPLDGTFVMPGAEDFPGRFVRRGALLGYVLAPATFTLLAVVPQRDVDLVRNRTERVELRSVDRIHTVLPADIVREVPAATRNLPSLALALQGGGTIGLDPSRGDGQAPQALTPLFQFEIRFTGDTRPRTLGSRVYVRFVHPDEPLAVQWYRDVRQVFLKRFEA